LLLVWVVKPLQLCLNWVKHARTIPHVHVFLLLVLLLLLLLPLLATLLTSHPSSAGTQIHISGKHHQRSAAAHCPQQACSLLDSCCLHVLVRLTSQGPITEGSK
jgi:hypothetical protein